MTVTKISDQSSARIVLFLLFCYFYEKDLCFFLVVQKELKNKMVEKKKQAQQKKKKEMKISYYVGGKNSSKNSNVFLSLSVSRSEFFDLVKNRFTLCKMQQKNRINCIIHINSKIQSLILK